LIQELVVETLNNASILYVVFCILAPIIFYLISVILAPKRPSKVKKMLFESGQTPIPYRVSPYPIEYFPYVIIYVAYALLALVAFITSISLMESTETIYVGVIVLSIITAASIYLSLFMRNLTQKLERGGG
jgi:NADH:ubiquinone oxidoreductase subunit 3 (subunit A)